jgi:hypothetical protein
MSGPRRFRWFRRRDLIVLGVFAAGVGMVWWMLFAMPGESWREALPPMSETQVALRERLQQHVNHLADAIGERNIEQYDALIEAERYITQQFEVLGYSVDRQAYTVGKHEVANLAAQRDGSDEIVIIGAHYDSAILCPGANDNATGTAAIIELARAFAEAQPTRMLRFVAFVNEEPPHFQTADMGSMQYAARCRQRDENIVAMIALDGLGCYLDEPGTQEYPLPVEFAYPSQGDFISMTGNLSSRSLLHRAIGSFRAHAKFPSEGAVLPGSVPQAGWSDHWAFWQHDYPGIMVTDTLPFRYIQYHEPSDTPEQIDFDRFARVVDGLRAVVDDLAMP